MLRVVWGLGFGGGWWWFVFLAPESSGDVGRDQFAEGWKESCWVG